MKEEVYLRMLSYLDFQFSGWSVSYTPWGERIICHLTLKGITRSGVGTDSRSAFREAAFLFESLRDYLTE